MQVIFDFSLLVLVLFAPLAWEKLVISRIAQRNLDLNNFERSN